MAVGGADILASVVSEYSVLALLCAIASVMVHSQARYNLFLFLFFVY